jgi:hypothetical protein
MRLIATTALGAAMALAASCLDVTPATNARTPGGEICCYADSPCGGSYACVDEHTYRAQREVPCEEACGCQPCSGASCEVVGPILECPAGTVCRPRANDPTDATCVPAGSSP